MTKLIEPKSPDGAWLSSYLCETLRDAKAYSIDAPQVTIKLDQNENPTDWPDGIKEQVLAELKSLHWNRYPEPYTEELNRLVANYAGVSPDACLLGTGSNYLLSILLNTFARYRKGRLLLARPSFALYESHCRYEGIPYEPWALTEDLEYDVDKLGDLPEGSMVVFASPNNPPGNGLAYDAFAKLLADHPKSLFVADEAYFEYVDQPYTPLLQLHDNLMIVRTFSKTMSLAGLRVGYILAAQPYIAHLRKLRLPFMLNHFSIAALRVVLTNEECRAHIQQTVATAKSERQRVYAAMHDLSEGKGFHVKPSQANFLLARWPSAESMTTAYRHLVASDILVRNVSAGPGLAGSLRITIGNQRENDALLAAMKSLPDCK